MWQAAGFQLACLTNKPGAFATGLLARKGLSAFFTLTVGGDAHPLYRWIVEQAGEAAAPRWNFHKYLIGKGGELVGGWPSKVAPLSPEITGAVEAAL